MPRAGKPVTELVIDAPSSQSSPCPSAEAGLTLRLGGQKTLGEGNTVSTLSMVKGVLAFHASSRSLKVAMKYLTVLRSVIGACAMWSGLAVGGRACLLWLCGPTRWVTVKGHLPRSTCCCVAVAAASAAVGRRKERPPTPMPAWHRRHRHRHQHRHSNHRGSRRALRGS